MRMNSEKNKDQEERIWHRLHLQWQQSKYHLSITDVISDRTSRLYARPLEIRTWLRGQGNLERFVILDDEIFWAWNWLADYFVCTTHLNDKGKCVYGMTDEDAERAIKILNGPLVKYSF